VYRGSGSAFLMSRFAFGLSAGKMIHENLYLI